MKFRSQISLARVLRHQAFAKPNGLWPLVAIGYFLFQRGKNQSKLGKQTMLILKQGSSLQITVEAPELNKSK